MAYQMYTLPNCEHCHKAVDIFVDKQIVFEKINVGLPEGLEKFKEFYAKHKDKITRDAKGTVNLPIIAYQNNGTFMIHQGREGLEKFLETN